MKKFSRRPRRRPMQGNMDLGSGGILAFGIENSGKFFLLESGIVGFTENPEYSSMNLEPH